MTAGIVSVFKAHGYCGYPPGNTLIKWVSRVGGDPLAIDNLVAWMSAERENNIPPIPYQMNELRTGKMIKDVVKN